MNTATFISASPWRLVGHVAVCTAPVEHLPWLPFLSLVVFPSPLYYLDCVVTLPPDV